MTLRERAEENAQWEAERADLKATITRLNRRVEKLQRHRDDLVEAVYNATMDAARALDIKPVRGARPRRPGQGSPEVAVATISDW
jgi:hypothetical protein